MLKALVIYGNEKTKTLSDILQIGKSLIKKKEHCDGNFPILNIIFDPLCKVFIVLYEDVQKAQV